MCGICGFWDISSSQEEKQKLIREMNDQMKHRGPDDEGYFVDNFVALGHRRLSIIDLEGGHQPILNEDNSIVVIYNGEIYNYQEIRSELIEKGHQFRTHSDTEMIIHAYEEYGPDCLQKFNGMFAFAIYDQPKKTLFIARDRFGIKPLYFCSNSSAGYFGFSSEIKPLLSHPKVEKSINYQALDSYFTYRYVPAPQTMFKNIFKLEPGYFLLLSEDSNLKKVQYYDVHYTKPYIELETEEEYISLFREKFEESVKKRLMAEVPLGIMLSGGLDSSCVVAGLARNLDNRLKTFSIGFKGDAEYNELNYAKLVAEKFNTDHYTIEIGYDQFLEGVEHYISFTEEPMADPASIPLYYVSYLASQHVTVILSGEGSDEILGGYDAWKAYAPYRKHLKVRRVPSLLRNGVIKPVNKYLLHNKKLQKYLDAASAPLSHHPYFFVSEHSRGNRFSREDKFKLFHPDIVDKIKVNSNLELQKETLEKTLQFDLLNQYLYVGMKYWLPDDLLLKADKMTMAHSLELRVPFLDHTFVEFVNSLPLEMKVNTLNGQNTTKYLLRKAYEDYLPSEILTRPKKGFPVPLAKMLKGELNDRLNDYLNSRTFHNEPVLNKQYVQILLDSLDNNSVNHPQVDKALWSIYVLLEWQNNFFV